MITKKPQAAAQRNRPDKKGGRHLGDDSAVRFDSTKREDLGQGVLACLTNSSVIHGIPTSVIWDTFGRERLRGRGPDL